MPTPQELCNLGVAHENGVGVAQDWAIAVRFYRRAAVQGNAEAQYAIGVCLARGNGVAQNWAEAARFYRLAAEQGDAAAQFSLGSCFERGEGVAQDWAKAARYYRLAAAQEGALSSELLAAITAACKRLACSREVASACCLGCGTQHLKGTQHHLKKCAGCRVARFCSNECHVRAWPAHKPNCKLWRGV
jgi:TPR repeat protein